MKAFINENILVPGKTWEPLNKEDFEDNIKKIIDAITCFGFFNESQLYFNALGIKHLLEDLNLIDGVEEYFLSNKIVQLREVIKKYDAIDWSENKLQKNDINYLVQLDGGYTPVPSNGTSIAEACEYSFTGEKTVVLNFPASVFNTYDVIKINRVNVNPPKDMVLVKIACLYKTIDSIRYYFENREAIGYKHHNKHGENHNVVKYEDGKPISPLKCKISEAVKLLKLSVGSKKSNELFAYDFERGEFIEFKYDNTENPKGYHGYHPHNQKIPADVEKFINDNKKNFNQLFEAL